MNEVLTCDEGGNPPANQVVEAHGAVVDVAQLAEHAVGVQALQEEPGEGAQVEEVQQDGDARAQELEPQDRERHRETQRDTWELRRRSSGTWELRRHSSPWTGSCFG